ncbi:hypothetical protein CHUAL_004197 [Chamberlinius hualienensis]
MNGDMNQSIIMSHGPQPLASRNSAMTSPSPSSPLTVKMNGSIPPPPVPVGRHHNGLPIGSPVGPILGKHPGSNTPTKQTYDMCGPSPDSKVMLSHSVLHDTSQELMSRSVLSAASGVPRLRTPNPIPTPTPTAPSSTTVTGTIPSPTLMLNPVVGGGGGTATSSTTHEQIQIHNKPIIEYSQCCSFSIHEVLSSLALLAIVSILLACMAVVFLLKVMSYAAFDPNGKLSELDQVLCNASSGSSSSSNSIFAGRIVDSNEFRLVYEIIVGLITCSISLDFTCMLICCAQFIFASKLAKAPHGKERALHYLKSSSCSRVIAIGGFFISIPVLLTGIILYAFIQFEAKSAIITSLLLGLSIVFCGLAMIHNVYVWQREKTKAAKLSALHIHHHHHHRVQTPLELKLRPSNSEQSSSQGLDVTQNASMELSTLV